MLLVLTSLVIGHLFLEKTSRKCMLFLAALAITIFKNGLRIFSLSMLAMYVDHSWIEGDLHHRYGGSIFFTLALVLILGVLHLLRRSEEKTVQSTPAQSQTRAPVHLGPPPSSV
jgi:exosortase/archaeosortase family protein